MLIYRLVFRLLVLARVDGETAHTLAAMALKSITGVPGIRSLIERTLAPRDPRLRVQALGMTFKSPLGLAAGVDSNASWYDGLGALGFGFVEVGTVTAKPQQGNPRPRVVRLIADRAILNRRGFPNDGASVVASRLRGRRTGPIVGVNIGKTSELPLDGAAEDYRASLRELAAVADYVVLNVSSPNTPELRDLQSTDRLRDLIADVRAELQSVGVQVPLLVKIAPDLSDQDLDAIADLALSVDLDGIVAVNTTVKREYLTTPSAVPAHFTDGGISGAPLKERALEVLRRLRARVGDRITLVSVGGIETADDAWDRLLAGATLLQAHTGFVYGGPLWPSHINRGLSRRLRAVRAASLDDVVGKESTVCDDPSLSPEMSPVCGDSVSVAMPSEPSRQARVA